MVKKWNESTARKFAVSNRPGDHKVITVIIPMNEFGQAKRLDAYGVAKCNYGAVENKTKPCNEFVPVLLHKPTFIVKGVSTR